MICVARPILFSSAIELYEHVRSCSSYRCTSISAYLAGSSRVIILTRGQSRQEYITPYTLVSLQVRLSNEEPAQRCSALHFSVEQSSKQRLIDMVNQTSRSKCNPEELPKSAF